MKPIVALWAHMRARSTAFLRMMIERDDMLVIHEPLVTLVDDGEVEVPDGAGGTIILGSEQDLFAHMRVLARDRIVFFKDTVEHRYGYLFANPEDIADFVHTFIIRNPRHAICSVYKMKPDISSPQIGYEHLWEIFTQASRLSTRQPVVVDAEKLVADPEKVVADYCRRVGIPFDPRTLSWSPGAQTHWRKTQHWHEDVSRSTGFHRRTNEYADTVDNNQMLSSFYHYHKRFYEKIAAFAI